MTRFTQVVFDNLNKRHKSSWHYRVGLLSRLPKYRQTPNSAAAGKVWRRRQPNFGWRASRISSAPAG